jgi:hypothetical protein
MSKFLKEHRQEFIDLFPEIPLRDDKVWQFFINRMDAAFDLGKAKERESCARMCDILGEPWLAVRIRARSAL